MPAKNHVRAVRFTPYRKGMGPVFTLYLYDLNFRDSAGRNAIGYRLTSKEYAKYPTAVFSCLTRDRAVFSHCDVDSDDAVKAVMGWLTLKPGDTDPDFFADYTPEQLAFASSHGETLALACIDRFGEE